MLKLRRASRLNDTNLHSSVILYDDMTVVVVSASDKKWKNEK